VGPGGWVTLAEWEPWGAWDQNIRVPSGALPAYVDLLRVEYRGYESCEG
jgi:hypothetical protein